MRVSVFGLGKLGSPILASLASAHHGVIGVDPDTSILKKLRQHEAPVPEPGLGEALALDRGAPFIDVTDDGYFAALMTEASIIIVPTPSNDDGSYDLKFVTQACYDIGRALAEKVTYHLVVVTSTIMPGDTAKVRDRLEHVSGKRFGKDFGLVYSPEFIALGSVMRDLRHPDYVLVGAENSTDYETFVKLWSTIVAPHTPFLRTTWINAEIAKIAQNCMITLRLVFANQLGLLCQHIPDANVDDITYILGHDRRIGPSYLVAGAPFGGPCFPRDNAALLAVADQANTTFPLAHLVDRLNNSHLALLEKEVRKAAADGDRIGIVGVSYKRGTPVLDASPSLRIAESLIEDGYHLILCDERPALELALKRLGRRAEYMTNITDCAAESNVLLLMHHRLDPDLVIELQTMVAERDDLVIVDPWRILTRDGITNVSRLPAEKLF